MQLPWPLAVPGRVEIAASLTPVGIAETVAPFVLARSNRGRKEVTQGEQQQTKLV